MAQGKYDRLICSRAASHVVIVLNRAPANPIDSVTLKELGIAFDDIELDEGVRAVVITGAGDRMFSAGADITEFTGASDQQRSDLGAMGCDLFDRIESFPKPVIAAINGFAFGGGNELAMACDIRIAARRARFGQPEINLGIIPGWGGIQRLARLIGRTRAQELLLTGEALDSDGALAAGLVSKVVDDEVVVAEAEAFAERLALQPPLAIAETKRLLNQSFDMSFGESIRDGARSFADLLNSGDGREGVAAFLEKRRPVFRGE